MPYFDHICLYTDGGSKGNSGPGAIGVVICDGDNTLLYEYSEYIGYCTNNQSEYRAVIKGLDLCARYSRLRVTSYSDSLLVVNQMNAIWRLKNDDLRGLYHQVRNVERVFREVVYQHVNRSANQRIKRADELLNQAHSGRPSNKCIVEP